MLHRQQVIQKARRIVIKIGSGILTDTQGIKPSFFRALAKEVAELVSKKKEIVLVSSGAVACGMGLMNLRQRPDTISKKQATAALGQPLLMQHYALAFKKYGLHVGQILLTRDDLQNPHRFLTAKHTFLELFRMGALPIINENDSVAVEEIKVGDNDQLSAMVAHLVDANLLIILTDTDGFFDQDPNQYSKAKRISLVRRVDGPTINQATDTLSIKSVGGMVTKLKAAKLAASHGIPTWILSGAKPQALSQVMEGGDIGTLFLLEK